MLSNKDQSFDRLARIYDVLVKLVFGQALKRAQIHFLSSLPEEGNVLVMGGGSGWILKEMYKVRPKIQVDYVEASGAMIERSKNREPIGNVNFIHGNELAIPPKTNYQAVITPFFLDLFGPIRLLATLSLIDDRMHPKGIWLFTDFQVSQKLVFKNFSRALIWTMYRFFRLTCKIEARELPDFDHAFSLSNYQLIKRKERFLGMVSSRIYTKKTDNQGD